MSRWLRPFTKKPGYAWWVWFLGATFFFAEYFAHVSISVMVPDLMRAFHVGAFRIGAMSSFFYYAYVGMQIPVGGLVDRYGPHRLMMWAVLVTGMSCWLFGQAHNIWAADIARFLMGFGSAFAFVGTLKLITIWFPPSKVGLMAGMTQAVGMLGASVGDGPVAYVVAHIGWRASLYWIAGFMVVLAVLVGVFVVEPAHTKDTDLAEHQAASGGRVLHNFWAVMRSPQAWLNGIFVGCLYAPTEAFGELWGPSYLHQTRGLPLTTAGHMVGMLFLGWAVGGPLCGWLSDKLGRRKPLMALSCVLSALCLLLVFYGPPMPSVVLYGVLFLFGFCNTGVGVSYALSSEICPRAMAGLSMAFANMMSVIIGAAFHPLIGYMLKQQWAGAMAQGVPVYPAHAYQLAMASLPAILLLGLLVLFFVKETHCRVSPQISG